MIMKYLYLLALAKPQIPQMSMTDLVANTLYFVYFGVGLIAVIIMVLAGYNYLTSNGNPEKAAKGLRTIIQCAIGIAVVIFAFALTSVITNGMSK